MDRVQKGEREGAQQPQSGSEVAITSAVAPECRCVYRDEVKCRNCNDGMLVNVGSMVYGGTPVRTSIPCPDRDDRRYHVIEVGLCTSCGTFAAISWWQA